MKVNKLAFKNKRGFGIVVHNLYLTTESQKSLNKLFSNISSFYVLDINDILKELPAINDNKYAVAFVNNYILDTIKEKMKLKKIKGIIYINKNLNKSIISNLKTKLIEESTDLNVVILDKVSLKLKDLYSECDEVVFFSRIKKIKLF